MKKLLMLICLSMAVLLPGYSLAKTTLPNARLEFKMDYKRTVDNHVVEHEMKNDVKLKKGKWTVLGKLQSSQNNDVTLLLVKLLNKKKNKFNIQLMLIDVGAREDFIIEPKTTVLAGLPASLKINQDDHEIKLSLLVVSES